MQSFIEAGDDMRCVKILKYSKPIVHFEIRGPTSQFSRLQMLNWSLLKLSCNFAEFLKILVCNHFLRQEMTNKCKISVNLDNFICKEKIPEKKTRDEHKCI